MFKKLFIISIFFLSSCAHESATSKKEVGELSFDVKEKVFKNGLKVLVVKNTKLPIFSYYTYYKVGGKYELEGMTGATHFLEHMMFKGAKKYGPGAFDQVVEGNGGSNNAYTTSDLTVYYENLPSKHLNTIIDVEADRMENLLLEKESFESERAVVLEERKMRYENSDNGKLFQEMMSEVFKNTPYGTSVIGSIEDIKNVSREKMHDYFKEFYAPNNATIIIVGDVEPNDVFNEIDKRFSKIPPYKGIEEEKKRRVKEKNEYSFKWQGHHEKKIKGKGEQPLFLLSFPGVKVGHEDSFALDLLSSILAGGDSSPLTQYFVRGKVPTLSYIRAANYTLMDSGVFFMTGELLRNANLASLKKNLKREIKLACESSLTERNLQKVRNQYQITRLSDLDTNAGVARFLGDYEIYYGDYNFYKKEMEVYNSVKVEDLKRVCSKYLLGAHSIFFSISK